jgi:hypothetical protein
MMSAILKGVMGVLTKLFMSFASEKLIEWMLFYVAEQIVKRTDTPHDDKFFEKIKEAYTAQ